MAIGRGSMTKELVGNRVKKKAMGGMAGAAGAPEIMGRDRGQAISSMARQGGLGGMRPQVAAAPSIGNVPPTPMNAVGGRPTVPMKDGGKVKAGMRGCGCAKRGTKGGKMV